MMANRAPDRYALPPELGSRDTTLWVVGKPFFLASAIKYVWRGWDHADDLRKAIDCLEVAYVHEAGQGVSFDLMVSDLQRIDWTDGDREHALFELVGEGFSPIDRMDIRNCIDCAGRRLKELEGEKG